MATTTRRMPRTLTRTHRGRTTATPGLQNDPDHREEKLELYPDMKLCDDEKNHHKSDDDHTMTRHLPTPSPGTPRAPAHRCTATLRSSTTTTTPTAPQAALEHTHAKLNYHQGAGQTEGEDNKHDMIEAQYTTTETVTTSTTSTPSPLTRDVPLLFAEDPTNYRHHQPPQQPGLRARWRANLPPPFADATATAVRTSTLWQPAASAGAVGGPRPPGTKRTHDHYRQHRRNDHHEIKSAARHPDARQGPHELMITTSTWNIGKTRIADASTSLDTLLDADFAGATEVLPPAGTKYFEISGRYVLCAERAPTCRSGLATIGMGSRYESLTTHKGIMVVAASLYSPPRFDREQLEDTLNRLQTFVDLTQGASSS